MLSYTLRRIAGLIPTLLVIITSRSVSCGWRRRAFDQEQALPPAVRANLERLYGLDQPLTVQYVHYLRGLLRGDFGPSLRQRDFTVSELIARACRCPRPWTAAILLAVLTGFPPASRRRCGATAALTIASPRSRP